MFIPTFVTTSALSPGLSHLSTPLSTPLSPRLSTPRHAPAPTRRAFVTMQETTKKKKKSKLVFAVDIKGNFVWNLRAATVDDVSAIATIIPNLPHSIVSSIVEDSPCCVVCEASVKGSKEGEGYSGRVLGAALADVTVMLKDKAVVKHADFVTVAADPELPDPHDVTKKLVLGCLKKLKEEGVVEVSSDVAAERDDRLDLLKACLFGVREKDGGRVHMTCRLASENPDPEKKMT